VALCQTLDRGTARAGDGKVLLREQAFTMARARLVPTRPNFGWRGRKREPGQNPGLSRSGVQKRPSSSALIERLGSGDQ